jgi:FixJ family two-component response regulator
MAYPEAACGAGNEVQEIVERPAQRAALVSVIADAAPRQSWLTSSGGRQTAVERRFASMNGRTRGFVQRSVTGTRTKTFASEDNSPGRGGSDAER